MTALRLRTLLFFFFNDTATTEIYPLSLHDALPICCLLPVIGGDLERGGTPGTSPAMVALPAGADRKSTRLNSSHLVISDAGFCLKKKTINASDISLRTWMAANTSSISA